MAQAWMVLRIVFAVIGILVGLSATFCFGIQFRNYDAGVFGFTSGVLAAVTLTVHILYRKQYFTYNKASHLTYLMYTGCIFQTIGVAGFIAYLSLGSWIYSQDAKFDIEGRNFFLTSVWCFMTWKWAFLLFHYSRGYRNELRQGSQAILEAHSILQ